MILVGQYDSPFVRRVAVALNLYGTAYEHRPWSVFVDAERLAGLNPLRRVPTLVLDSVAILDHLDEVAGGARLLPAAGQARRAMLRTCALATGLCDKLVSLVYEQVLHAEPSEAWVGRCAAQVEGVLAALERERATCTTPFWFGDRPGHPDIAVACAMRFLAEAHPALHAAAPYPHLDAHAAACEAMAAFSAAVQPFTPPRRAG